MSGSTIDYIRAGSHTGASRLFVQPHRGVQPHRTATKRNDGRSVSVLYNPREIVLSDMQQIVLTILE